MSSYSLFKFFLVFFSFSFFFLNAQSNEALDSKNKSKKNSLLTNTIIHDPTVIPKNPLEWYAQSTSEDYIRRTEVIFFISIPFAYLWTNFLYTLFPQASNFSAYFDGVRGNQLRAGNFNYNREGLPVFERVDNPFYIFLWTSSTLWPTTIALNSFLERASDPKIYDEVRKKIIKNRAPLQRISQNEF